MPKINWDLPIETDEDPPRKAHVFTARTDGREEYSVVIDGGTTQWYLASGMACFNAEKRPRIRNVQAKPAIDWNLPIETDEPTPRSAVVQGPCAFPGYYVNVNPDDKGAVYEYYLTGFPAYSTLAPKIRNVQTAPAPAPDVTQRMEALVRRLADHSFYQSALETDRQFAAEAREIVAALTPPAGDPIWKEAKKLFDESDFSMGDFRTERAFAGTAAANRLVLAALKRGQELAHGEYAADLENPGTFYRSIDLPAL